MASVSPAVLRIRGGPEDGRMIFLSGGFTRIGRGTPNEISIDDPGVSRQHATIRGAPDGYWITDLGSRNGTLVNGVPVGQEPRRLENRDVIQVGAAEDDIHLVFMRSQETLEG